MDDVTIPRIVVLATIDMLKDLAAAVAKPVTYEEKLTLIRRTQTAITAIAENVKV